ncbi:hypothetical protein M0812_25354 [Anaeramoeba flamelloides]|uniref:Reverse transcriptase zinc-binding domain-containing protein n=1 Tax=Anaeramoeba flamelloides TaxID=1746091 RepID=A0AAV7YD13_9EUKA|nr:hypothetical protein M0812_25354 [Anaeramoeba flamelloides]
METRIEPIQFSILKRKAKFIQKISELNLKYLSQELKLPDIPNINWKFTSSLQLKNQFKNYYIQLIQDKIDKSQNRENWKLKKYLKMTNFPNNFWEKQDYLQWKSSSTLFKFKSFTNGLKRYSYHLDKPDSSKDCHCKNDQDETIDHFIWDCPKYKKKQKYLEGQIRRIKIY